MRNISRYARLRKQIAKDQMLNAFSTRSNDRLVFERLVNRINRTMAEWKSRALIFHDEGKDYTTLIRRLRVYNPVPSQFGRWPDGKLYRNMPTDRLIEDIVFRDSRQSHFIQMADFCAYALFRSEVPLASKERYGLNNAFELLEPICIKSAAAKDHRSMGIIRC